MSIVSHCFNSPMSIKLVRQKKMFSERILYNINSYLYINLENIDNSADTLIKCYKRELPSLKLKKLEKIINEKYRNYDIVKKNPLYNKPFLPFIISYIYIERIFNIVLIISKTRYTEDDKTKYNSLLQLASFTLDIKNIIETMENKLTTQQKKDFFHIYILDFLKVKNITRDIEKICNSHKFSHKYRIDKKNNKKNIIKNNKNPITLNFE